MNKNEINKKIFNDFVGVEGVPVDTDYTANISDAFKLLEILHEKGWFYRIDSLPKGVECIVQRLIDIKDPNKRQTFTVRAETIPLAISEVAMRILENGKT